MCEVYDAEAKVGGTPMTETTWYDAKSRSVIKRKITQGGYGPIVIIQLRTQ